MPQKASNKQASVAESSAILPYSHLQESCPCTVLQECSTADLEWQTRIAVRSWLRLRADLIELTSRSGSRSSARIRSCIFCSEPSRNPSVHVLGRCARWGQLRAEFLAESGQGTTARAEEVAVAMLTMRPGMPGFGAAVRLCGEVDAAAKEFWSS